MGEASGEQDAGVPPLIRLLQESTGMPMRVGRVHTEGFKHTRPELLADAVAILMQAATFGDVQEKIAEAQHQLERLGIFKNVEFSLNPSSEFAGEVDVTIAIEERNRFELKTEVATGMQEAIMITSGTVRNYRGYGEVLSGTYSAGTRGNASYEVNYTRPLADARTAFNVCAFQTTNDYSAYSSHIEILRGAILTYMLYTDIGQHNFRYHGVWRELGSSGPEQSWAMRQNMGHSLKSSIEHTFTRDLRDSRVAPTRGFMMSSSQEYAGVGGDVGHVKCTAEAQQVFPLGIGGLIASLTVNGGFLYPMRGRSFVSDRFFLGGPTNLRGFNIRGAGPRDTGDALGGDIQWAAGLSIRSPAYWLRRVTGDALQYHGWFNAGNSVLMQKGLSAMHNVERLLNSPARVTCGAGLLLNFNNSVRLEINYCHPIATQPGDIVRKGLQIGLGMSFL